MDNLRLADGTLFPMPINLDVSAEDVKALGIKKGARIALQDPRDDVVLAVLTVEDVYAPDKIHEAKTIFGAGENDVAHPSIAYLHEKVKEFYVGGSLQAICLPTYFDYVALRCMCSHVSCKCIGLNLIFRYPR